MPSDSEIINVLLKQADEQSQYIRINIQLLVQWFIFFATANYVTLGYFVTKMVDAKLTAPRAFYVVAALFLVVNVFAFLLCWQARTWFLNTAKLTRGITGTLDGLTNLPSHLTQQSSPLLPYSQVAILMSATIAVIFVTWTILIIAVIKR